MLGPRGTSFQTGSSVGAFVLWCLSPVSHVRLAAGREQRHSSRLFFHMYHSGVEFRVGQENVLCPTSNNKEAPFPHTLTHVHLNCQHSQTQTLNLPHKHILTEKFTRTSLAMLSTAVEERENTRRRFTSSRIQQRGALGIHVGLGHLCSLLAGSYAFSSGRGKTAARVAKTNTF